MVKRYDKPVTGWTGRWTFVLAATGSTVGLGNIWKFPSMAGADGGTYFILIYLLCLVLMGIPLLMAEVALGRRARRNPVAAIEFWRAEVHAGKAWLWAGRLGILAGFLVLSFYAVVGGFGLAYVFFSAFGDFVNAGHAVVLAELGRLTASPEDMVGWHTLFIALVIVVSLRGVNRGLERALRVIMPALFILLAILLLYVWRHADFDHAMAFLFSMNSGHLRWQTLFDALGHAFFTLSLGMAVMMAYGAYMPPRSSVVGSAVVIALADTLVALAAGLVVFSAVFSQNLAPSAGFGLLFQSVPEAFGGLPGGQFIGSMFFLVVSLAAWSSAISVMEPAVAWCQERLGLARQWAVVGVGVAAWLMGLGTVFSFNIWSQSDFLGANFFEWINFVTASLLLPLTGFLITLFAGRVVSSGYMREAMGLRWRPLYVMVRWSLRYLSPVAIVLVCLWSVHGFMSALCVQTRAPDWCPAAGGNVVPGSSPAPELRGGARLGLGSKAPLPVVPEPYWGAVTYS